ncbi:LamG-like jellyroll fold domain-containing protein [Chitinophaga rhizosphaerae]|uniref:LamG-like jellyroll fold domain-containing protein n=1 Tax=Chitinophaga rhizosphaerae TaxID=1864947 RepID=UPI000F7FD195|nr:LamG-like jellyroll fold domain-containing protein [Chitinophaga rhizosphaerae]
MKKIYTALCVAGPLFLFGMLSCIHAFSQTMSRYDKLIIQKGINIQSWSRNDHPHEGAFVKPVESIQVGRTGRYVRVQMSNTEPLYLAEVQVFSNGTNIALGNPVTQSTTAAAGSKAVDGNTDGNYANGSVASTAQGRVEMEAWWSLDLGSVSQIDSILIFSRTDIIPNHIKGFYLFVSDNPYSGNTLQLTLSQAGVSSYRQTYPWPLLPPPASEYFYAGLSPQYHDMPGFHYDRHAGAPTLKWGIAKVGRPAANSIDHIVRYPSAFEKSNGFLNSMQLAHLDKLQSICVGDEEDYPVSQLPIYKEWFQIIREKYPDVLFHTNQRRNEMSETQERFFLQDGKPDMLTFDYYYFDSQNTTYKTDDIYIFMAHNRRMALGGHDGTGTTPIIFGGYLQSYRGRDPLGSELYMPAESEINLNIFAFLGMGVKWMSYFHQRSSMIFKSGALTPQYYQIARAVQQANNLTPHLSRLRTSDLRFIPGKKLVNGVVTNNASVPDAPAWSATADPYVKSITATNLVPATNNGLPGSLLIGYFKPVPGLNNTPGITMAPVLDTFTRYFMIVNGLYTKNGCCYNDVADTLLGKANLSKQKITLSIDFGTSAVDTLYRVSRATGASEIVPLTHVSGSQFTVSDTLDGGLGDLFFWKNAGSPNPPSPHNAVSLAGGSISAGNVTQLNGASKFTIETWAKFNSTSGWNHVFYKGVSTTQRMALQSDPTGRLYANVSNGANSYGATAPGTVVAGQWYHFAMVYDGTQSTSSNRLKLYINGAPATLVYGVIPASSSNNAASLDFGFGGFDGTIDEVRVWNTDLAATTVSGWKDKVLGSCHPNAGSLVAYWRLNNNAGNTVATASLGTAYAGAITNGTYITSTQATGVSGCPGGPESIAAVAAGPSSYKLQPGNTGMIYPNPLTGDVLYIGKLPGGKAEVEITVVNMDGKVCKSQRMAAGSAGPVAFNTGKLPPGMYLLRITSRQGKVLKTDKFIKL